jgi:hypothetical protein
MDTDPYRTLGLDETASERELRAAFHRLVHALHPDRRAGDPRAAERLREVVAAYEAACGLRQGRSRRAPRRAAHASCDPHPAPPRERLRYACTRCDDTFAFEGECPRCACALHDAWSGAPPPPPDAQREALITALVTELEARGEPRESALAAHAPAWMTSGFALAGLLAFGVYVPVGAMFLGYALFFALVQLHARRAATSLESMSA